MRKFQILITLFLALFLAACGTHTLNYSSKTPIFYEEDGWKVFFDNDRFGFKDQNGSVVIGPQFDLALDFKNGVARVVQNEKYGLIDKSGKFILKPQFDDISYFSDSVFLVKKDEKFGLITLDGKTILEPKFILPDKWRNIKAPYIIFINNEKLTKIVIDDKTGFIDENGKIVVEPKFDFASRFFNGLAAVRLKDKWGFVDEKGKMVIKAKYDSVSSFKEGFAAVKLNEKWGLINTKREFVIKPEFDKIDQVENAIIIEKNGKYGIASFDGKILEPQFDYIQKSYNQKIFLVEKNSKIGLVSKEAQVLVEPKFDKASYRENDILQVEIDKKLGLFDIKSKQFILEPKFDDMYNFYNKFIGVYFQGKKGLFDINNRRFVLEPKFEISSCGGTSRVSLNGKYGIINDKAEFIVPIKYDYISSCFSNDLSFASIKDKTGYINKNAELIIPAKFETVTPFKYGFAQVKLDRNKKFGLINTKGDLVLPFEFDSIHYIEPLATSETKLREMKETNEDKSVSKEQMFFIVEKKGKFGVMDNHRKWIVKPQNYFIKYFDKDMGFIISDGLHYGVINMQGKVIIKPQYEEIYKFSNRLYRVKKEDENDDYKLNTNDKIGIINEKGEFVLEPKFDYINTDKYPFKFIQGAKYGFLDEKAKVLFEINFAYEDDLNNDILTLANKYWLVQKKGESQIFDMKNNQAVFDIFFDNIARYDNFISVTIANKIGVMDENLNWLILPKFDEFKRFGKNHYKIALDNKIGLLDKNLHTILEPKYDYIGENFINGFVKIGLNDKYGFIGENGKIIEPQFDYVWSFEDNWDFKDNMVAKVFTGKEIKFINTKGEFVE